MVRSYILGEDETLFQWVISLTAGYLVGRFIWNLLNMEKWVTMSVNWIRGLVGLPKIENGNT